MLLAAGTRDAAGDVSGAGSACAALRSATEAAHVRLHAHPGFAALLRGNLSIEGYARLLLRLLGLHAPMEERLAQHDAMAQMQWRGIGPTSTRSDLLRRDLAAIGVAASAVAAVPRADALLPSLDGPTVALGSAWVVEGSALGGSVLGRRVADITGKDRAGGEFLSARPGQTERWQACRAAVEAYGADLADRKLMIRAAVDTFVAFEAWLRDPG